MARKKKAFMDSGMTEEEAMKEIENEKIREMERLRYVEDKARKEQDKAMGGDVARLMAEVDAKKKKDNVKKKKIEAKKAAEVAAIKAAALPKPEPKFLTRAYRRNRESLEAWNAKPKIPTPPEFSSDEEGSEDPFAMESIPVFTEEEIQEKFERNLGFTYKYSAEDGMIE